MRPTGAIAQFTTCILDANSMIELYQPKDDPDGVSILLGEEQLKLDCYDEDVLERLVAVATAGMRALRARRAG